MNHKEVEIFYPDSQAAWRTWLEKHHHSKQAIWLVYYTKKSALPTITWSEAVDMALCFGWIDSKRVKIDEKTSRQFFTKRKPQSTWSKINKEKVNILIQQGLMAEAGYKVIETAKQNGSWEILDEVEALITPKDLEDAFANNPQAREFFYSQSKSVKKMILTWLLFAKSSSTRQKRITEIIECASQNLKPIHMR